MAVIATATGGRNVWQSLRRIMDSAWFGNTNNSERVPLALSNESIVSVNAAGTGVVELIKANSSDLPQLGDGVVVTTVSDSAGVHRMVPVAAAKTIVDSAATSLFDVACAASAMVGGLIFYEVNATDGTDFQSMSGIVSYAAVNKATALTLAITNATANDAKAVSSGTLTLSFTFVAGTAKGTVKVQPTGSLTETAPYTITFTVFPTSGTITIV